MTEKLTEEITDSYVQLITRYTETRKEISMEVFYDTFDFPTPEGNESSCRSTRKRTQTKRRPCQEHLKKRDLMKEKE